MIDLRSKGKCAHFDSLREFRKVPYQVAAETDRMTVCGILVRDRYGHVSTLGARIWDMRFKSEATAWAVYELDADKRHLEAEAEDACRLAGNLLGEFTSTHPHDDIYLFWKGGEVRVLVHRVSLEWVLHG